MSENEKWFAIFRAGNYGEKGDWPVSRLQKVASNYDPDRVGRAALQVEHDNAAKPVFGFIEELKVVGDTLWAKPKELVESFVQMVRDKKFRGVSAQFNKAFDYLCHVAFLIESDPHVEGLPEATFSKLHGVDAVSFDISKVFAFSEPEPGDAGSGEGTAKTVKRLTEEITEKMSATISEMIAKEVAALVDSEITKAAGDALWRSRGADSNGYPLPPISKEIANKVRAAVEKIAGEAGQEALKAFQASFSKRRGDTQINKKKETDKMKKQAVDFSADEKRAIMSKVYDRNKAVFEKEKCGKEAFLKYGIFQPSWADEVGFDKGAVNFAASSRADASGVAGGSSGDLAEFARSHDKQEEIESQRRAGFWLKNREAFEGAGVTREQFVKHGKVPAGYEEEMMNAASAVSFSDEDRGVFFDQYAKELGSVLTRESFIKHGAIPAGWNRQ